MCRNSVNGCDCHVKNTNVIKTYNVGTVGAKGEDGIDGLTPYIGLNGNWWIGNTDTGVQAGSGGGLTIDQVKSIAGTRRLFLTSDNVSQMTVDYDVYIWDGSVNSTFSLPTDIGNSGKTFTIKNTGTANLVVQKSGVKQIYDTALVNSITIPAGGSKTLTMIGTQYWITY